MDAKGADEGDGWGQRGQGILADVQVVQGEVADLDGYVLVNQVENFQARYTREETAANAGDLVVG